MEELGCKAELTSSRSQFETTHEPVMRVILDLLRQLVRGLRGDSARLSDDSLQLHLDTAALACNTRPVGWWSSPEGGVVTPDVMALGYNRVQGMYCPNLQPQGRLWPHDSARRAREAFA